MDTGESLLLLLLVPLAVVEVVALAEVVVMRLAPDALPPKMELVLMEGEVVVVVVAMVNLLAGEFLPAVTAGDTPPAGDLDLVNSLGDELPDFLPHSLVVPAPLAPLVSLHLLLVK